ncbi:MAG TPA: prepilin-type N-terminal cleavage/methylation domain-containing protein, partial [Desulfuromonadaceae bacterium]|nr:prepilin-type N-terminal cleavage/methylation domain-containing protein [Desulfuromonadaceae bacterium]
MRTRFPIADCRLPIENPVIGDNVFSRKETARATRHPSPVTAFTLIEIMIAITIFMLVLAAIYSTWFMIVRASRVSQDAAARIQRQRIAIRTLEDSLTGIESFQASLQYYSFTVDNGDKPALAFTAHVPDDFPRSGRFGDFSVRRLLFTVESVKDPVELTTENDLV